MFGRRYERGHFCAEIKGRHALHYVRIRVWPIIGDRFLSCVAYCSNLSANTVQGIHQENEQQESLPEIDRKARTPINWSRNTEDTVERTHSHIRNPACPGLAFPFRPVLYIGIYSIVKILSCGAPSG